MKVELLLNSNSTKESLYPFSNNYMVKICVNKTLGGNNLVLQFFAMYSTVWLPILGNYGFFANCKSLSSFTSPGSFKSNPFQFYKESCYKIVSTWFQFRVFNCRSLLSFFCQTVKTIRLKTWLGILFAFEKMFAHIKLNSTLCNLMKWSSEVTNRIVSSAWSC